MKGVVGRTHVIIYKCMYITVVVVLLSPTTTNRRQEIKFDDCL